MTVHDRVARNVSPPTMDTKRHVHFQWCSCGVCGTNVDFIDDECLIFLYPVIPLLTEKRFLEHSQTQHQSSQINQLFEYSLSNPRKTAHIRQTLDASTWRRAPLRGVGVIDILPPAPTGHDPIFKPWEQNHHFFTMFCVMF